MAPTSFWARAPLARCALLPFWLLCPLLLVSVYSSSKLTCWPSPHVQVYKALRNNVQECAVKRLRNVNKTELANFQRVRNSHPEALVYVVT